VVRITCPSLGVGQRNLQQTIELQNVLLAQEIDSATHVFESGRLSSRGGRPSLEKQRERSKHRQIVLTRQPGEFRSARGGACGVAAHQIEQRRMLPSKRARAGVGHGGYAGLSAFE
jgi:hypothetical protein